MRIRIRDTASDRKETDGEPWERVDLFRGFRHDDVKKANKKKFPTGKRYYTIPIFEENGIHENNYSSRKTEFCEENRIRVILRRKLYGTYSSKKTAFFQGTKKPTEGHNRQEANNEMI
jgi:hypothetical protein